MISRRAASPATSANRVGDRLGEGPVVGEADRPRKWVVLELRDQIRGDHVRVGSGRRDDHDLARSRELIDTDSAEDLVLGKGHKHVAGSDDHVDALDALGAERERRDGLRAPGDDHLTHAEQVRRGGDQRMHPS